VTINGSGSAKGLLGLLSEALKEWLQDKAARLGAALAFYAIFALGPLIIIVIGVAGFVFGQSAAKDQLASSISSLVGEDAANAIQQLVKNTSDRTADTVASIVGTAVLIFAAAAIFGQLKDALNTIWKIRVKPGAGIMPMIWRNLLSFLMVIGIGLLLVVSMLADAVLAAINGFAQGGHGLLGGTGTQVWQLQLGNYAVTLGVTILLFAMVYKVLPDAKISWNTVWVGALVTALLFLAGQIGLGIYFSVSNLGSAFGAASSVVALLLWIYYSAQIFLVGAEITQVYSSQSGHSVTLSSHVEWASAEIKSAREASAGEASAAQPSTKAAMATRSSPWFR